MGHNYFHGPQPVAEHPVRPFYLCWQVSRLADATPGGSGVLSFPGKPSGYQKPHPVTVAGAAVLGAQALAHSLFAQANAQEPT